MAFLTEADRKYKTPEDICAHLGDDYGKFCGAIVPPIFQNSLFVQPTDVNGVSQTENVYTRLSNPTTDIAERKIAALEGAEGALCFSSGMAALTAAIMHFVKSDCHVILLGTSYSNVKTFVMEYLHKKFNVEYTVVRGDSVEEIEAAVRPTTTLIYLESPSSQMFIMQDLEAVAAIAKAHGIGTVIDNTYATPLHQQPLKYGIDIVCHTASKYLGGHSDIIAGALAANREILESIQYNERMLYGNVMDPHQAWLLLRGLRTLPMRLKQHGQNAAKVYEFLVNHPKVRKVIYPGSDSYGQRELFDKYMTGTNGLMSFEPIGTREQVKAFTDSLYYFQNGVSWGGFESLCQLLSADEITKASDQPENLVRIHVGLEDPNTLIADLAQAFEKIPLE